jgi:hypothetical protein
MARYHQAASIEWFASIDIVMSRDQSSKIEPCSNEVIEKKREVWNKILSESKLS